MCPYGIPKPEISIFRMECPLIFTFFYKIYTRQGYELKNKLLQFSYVVPLGYCLTEDVY